MQSSNVFCYRGRAVGFISCGFQRFFIFGQAAAVRAFMGLISLQVLATVNNFFQMKMVFSADVV